MNTRSLIYACLASVAAVLLLAQPARAVVLDRIVAVVGQEAITWLELHEKMKTELLPRMGGMSEDEKAEAFRKAENEFLQALIVRRLQIQEAKKEGVAATPEDVDAAIEDIRRKYGLDEQGFRKAISSEGLDWDSYREMIWEQITLRRIVDRKVRSKLPGDLKAEGPELYVLGLVVFRPEGPDDDPSARAEGFLEETEAGGSFEELAPYRSGGTVSELRINADDLSETFRDALEGMEPGGVSRTFSVNGGVGVLKLYERIAPEEIKYEKLFEEHYSNWMKELLDNSYVDVRL